ncbi:MAG: double-strand break repair helicase AddA [Pseudomonadota bacterium]
MSPRGPTPEQADAANPASSAWVGANAGSGKTRVLTERVARLLLDGAQPEAILCLTYTKAAAVEMQRRLFGLLGDWAMAEDAPLAEALSALTGRAAELDPDRLARARRLFARALETPGGLKIQTIHAFCETLLRRFPLEAGLSPRFTVLEERSQALLLRQVRMDMATAADAGQDMAFDAAAQHVNDETFEALIGAILAGRSAFTPESAAAIDLLPGSAENDPDEEALAALSHGDWEALSRLAAAMTERGQNLAAADGLAKAHASLAHDPTSSIAQLLSVFLTTDGAPRRRRGFPATSVLERVPEAGELTDRMIDWAVKTREARHATRNARRSQDLYRFATGLLSRYRKAKDARALLDFDDLIERTEALLTDPGIGPWVLYRLDGRIEHILVDEAQDTAPAQWRLIEAIAAEFHAGASSRPADRPRRTLFVVGDEKQSIYSFQGADPEMFGEMRQRFARRLEAVGTGLTRPSLVTSFRSAPGVLRFVDAVFANNPSALNPSGDPIEHRASRARDGSRVDVWPCVPDEPGAPMPNWWEPVAAQPPLKAKPRLARILATEIARMIAEEHLPAREGRPLRLVRAGDILVLVRTRDALAAELIRSLKQHGVPVAGADRLKLAEGLVVKDLLALMKVATLPSDDLSLAAVLRSPLCGVDEDALFRLAHNRPGWLIEALQTSEHTEDAAMIADMAARADYLRPYEFLERVLIRHNGRQRLVARLGPEAEDLIDELLEQALTYENREIPTLAGFITWIETAEVAVKREMESATDAVRVMTVHGAKGLEAPVVILPDTIRPRGGKSAPILPARTEGEGEGPRVMLWMPPTAGDDRRTATARDAAKARERAEGQRLLYVALTRAEDWLILCGAGNAAKDGTDWYGQLSAAALRLEAAERPSPKGLDGALLRLEDEGPEDPILHQEPPVQAKDLPMPEWIAPAPAEARQPLRAPSSLLPVPPAKIDPSGRDRATALAHGRAVHLLLERLGDLPVEQRPDAAERLLATEPGLDAAGRAAALAEADSVLAAPFAARIFGPGSLAEVGLALTLPEIARRPIVGRIDRLVIDAEQLLIVDFKTDPVPPERPEDVAPGYLAQMGAYAAALTQQFPKRRIEASLLWTATPSLMSLPAVLIGGALAEAAQAGPLDSTSGQP